MKLKLLVAVALFAVGFGAIGYVLLAPGTAGAATTTYLTATATTTDVTQEAVATGSVAASTSYGLGFGRSPATIASGAAELGCHDRPDVDRGRRQRGHRRPGDRGRRAGDRDQHGRSGPPHHCPGRPRDGRAAAGRRPWPSRPPTIVPQPTRHCPRRRCPSSKRTGRSRRRGAPTRCRCSRRETAVSDAETQYENDQDDDADSSILAQDRRTLRDAKRSLTDDQARQREPARGREGERLECRAGACRRPARPCDGDRPRRRRDHRRRPGGRRHGAADPRGRPGRRRTPRPSLPLLMGPSPAWTSWSAPLHPPATPSSWRRDRCRSPPSSPRPTSWHSRRASRPR